MAILQIYQENKSRWENALNLGVINLKKVKLHPLQIDSPTGTQVAINNGKGRLIEKYQSNGKIKKINLESGQYSVEARNGDKSFIRMIKLPNLYGKSYNHH